MKKKNGKTQESSLVAEANLLQEKTSQKEFPTPNFDPFAPIEQGMLSMKDALDVGDYILMPTPEHFNGLTEESLHYPFNTKMVLKRLFEGVFKGISITTGLDENSLSGEVWNVGETAIFNVKIKNDTGFHIKNIRLRFQILQGFHVAFEVPNTPHPNVKFYDFGNIDFNESKTASFHLKATSVGVSVLRFYLWGKIAPYEEEFFNDGQYYFWEEGMWKKKWHPVFLREVITY